MAKVDQLPSEILSLILSYLYQWDLPSCALINKSFYRESMPLLWREITIWSKESFLAIPTRLMQSPIAPGQHVRSLTIRDMYAYADVIDHAQDDTYFESLDNLQHIPRYCPHLTSLTIDCGIDPDPIAYRIAQAMVVSAGHYCKQLTKLDLFDGMYSNYDDLFDALKDAPLTDIQLSLSDRLDLQVAQQFVETAPLALHRYQLTTLSISPKHDSTSFINTINTHGLTWPHLTYFDLKWCHSLTDAMALTFVKAHPTIERLELNYSGITDAFLDGLVDYLPNLTMLSLDFTAITAPGICRLITNYGSLDWVHCEGCDISPKDVPNDKTYDYKLVLDDEKEPQVQWFNGTFS